MFSRLKFVLSFFSFAILSGCVSVADINHSSSKIENAWLLEYQRVEETQRTRVIEASSSQTYDEVKRALVEIGLPIIESDLVEGEIFAQGIAPAPLTQKEWELVVEAENQRVKELSDGWLYLDDDPSDYVLTVKVSILGTDKKSLVVLDYVLSAPKYEAMGFKMPRVAPPQAVLIGSERFWRTLDNNLRNSSVAPVRQKRKGEAFRSA